MADNPNDADLRRGGVAVVIPCYNGATFCGQAIESALAQQDVPVEVIFVDDGSSDDSHVIAARYDGVRVIRQPNGGVSRARNTGLAEVRAPYVIFLDADDMLLPDAAAQAVRAFVTNDSVAITFGGSRDIDATGKVIAVKEQSFRRFALKDVFFNTIPRPSQAALRTDAVRAVGGFEEGRVLCEDFELYTRLLADGSAGVCHGGLAVDYRRHGAQATHNVSAMLNAALDVVDRALRRLPPGGEQVDAAALRRFWKQELGGFVPYEIARSLLARKWSKAASASRTFVASLPYSAIGSAKVMMGLRH